MPASAPLWTVSTAPVFIRRAAHRKGCEKGEADMYPYRRPACGRSNAPGVTSRCLCASVPLRAGNIRRDARDRKRTARRQRRCTETTADARRSSLHNVRAAAYPAHGIPLAHQSMYVPFPDGRCGRNGRRPAAGTRIPYDAPPPPLSVCLPVPHPASAFISFSALPQRTQSHRREQPPQPQLPQLRRQTALSSPARTPPRFRPRSAQPVRRTLPIRIRPQAKRTPAAPALTSPSTQIRRAYSPRSTRLTSHARRSRDGCRRPLRAGRCPFRRHKARSGR